MSNKLNKVKKDFQKKLLQSLNRKRIEEISKKRSEYNSIKKSFANKKEKRKVFKTEEKITQKLEHRKKIKSKLNNLLKKTVKLNLQQGSFNGSIIKIEDHYICVYRKTENQISGCKLKKDYSVEEGSHFEFMINNATDPRLIWFNNEIVMSYSTTGSNGREIEYIAGSIIFKENKFINSKSFRISPISDYRQKNWMPFIYDNKLFYISSVCPHKIYELKTNKKEYYSELVFETNWSHPWFDKVLRGNTNCIKLDDGNYLSTFHSAIWYEEKCYYDNGAYIFEGKPPFNVIYCSESTFLNAESAIEPHIRNHQKKYLMCTFPVGLILENEKLIISYGDNDSCVKISELELEEIKKTMVKIKSFSK